MQPKESPRHHYDRDNLVGRSCRRDDNSLERSPLRNSYSYRRGNERSPPRRDDKRNGPQPPMRRGKSCDRSLTTRSMSRQRERENSLERMNRPNPMRRNSSFSGRPRSPPQGRDNSLERRPEEWSAINSRTRSKASDLSILSQQVSASSRSKSRTARSVSAGRSLRLNRQSDLECTSKDPREVKGNQNALDILKIIQETRQGKSVPQYLPSRATKSISSSIPRPPPQQHPDKSFLPPATKRATATSSSASSRVKSPLTDVDHNYSDKRYSASSRSSTRQDDDNSLTRDTVPKGIADFNNGGHNNRRLSNRSEGLNSLLNDGGPAVRGMSFKDRSSRSASFNSLFNEGGPVSTRSSGYSNVTNTSGVNDDVRIKYDPPPTYANPLPPPPRVQHPSPPAYDHYEKQHQEFEMPMKSEATNDSEDWRKYQVKGKGNREGTRRSHKEQQQLQQHEQSQEHSQQQPIKPLPQMQPASGDDQSWLKYKVNKGQRSVSAGRSMGGDERKSKMFGREPRNKHGNERIVRSVKQMPFTDQFGDFGTYSGQVNEDGRPDGKGSMKYENGVFYEGTWTDGCQDKQAADNYQRIRGGFTSWGGKGKSGVKSGMVLPWNARKNDAHNDHERTNVRGMEWTDLNGDSGRYTGEVNNDQLPQGRGIMKYSYGLIAEGEWTNGVLKEGPQDRMISAAASMGGGMSVHGGMSVGPMSVGPMSAGPSSIGPGMSVVSMGQRSFGTSIGPSVAPTSSIGPRSFGSFGGSMNASHHVMIAQQNAAMRYGGVVQQPQQMMVMQPQSAPMMSGMMLVPQQHMMVPQQPQIMQPSQPQMMIPQRQQQMQMQPPNNDLPQQPPIKEIKIDKHNA